MSKNLHELRKIPASYQEMLIIMVRSGHALSEIALKLSLSLRTLQRIADGRQPSARSKRVLTRYYLYTMQQQ